MKLLLFGFPPFGGDRINPSEHAVRALAAEPPPGMEIVPAVLAVSFAAMPALLADALERTRPDSVLGLGQAAGRAELAIERVALNLIDARIPDNEGVQPIDVPVLAGGPPALFARLPVKAMAAAVSAAGVPATLSLSAGSFVCNAALYLACRHGVPAGFIHLPVLPEQSADHPAAPTMALATMVRGLRAALGALRDTRRDFAEAGGTLH
jgi:pyroglutamyl-peptidase